jgi:hypothetical protein
MYFGVGPLPLNVKKKKKKFKNKIKINDFFISAFGGKVRLQSVKISLGILEKKEGAKEKEGKEKRKGK